MLPPHRQAIEGLVQRRQGVCGYHGWTYDRTGKLVSVPQFTAQQEIPNLAGPAFHCEARYGYAWVALDEPLAPILDAAEEHDPRYRRIPQFYEVWNTSALRLIVAWHLNLRHLLTGKVTLFRDPRCTCLRQKLALNVHPEIHREDRYRG
jgi:phenylpropionate dioxygenase-like ring-hydroxylating dioxygenase large terminal subunit